MIIGCQTEAICIYQPRRVGESSSGLKHNTFTRHLKLTLMTARLSLFIYFIFFEREAFAFSLNIAGYAQLDQRPRKEEPLKTYKAELITTERHLHIQGDLY